MTTETLPVKAIHLDEDTWYIQGTSIKASHHVSTLDQDLSTFQDLLTALSKDLSQVTVSLNKKGLTLTGWRPLKEQEAKLVADYIQEETSRWLSCPDRTDSLTLLHLLQTQYKI